MAAYYFTDNGDDVFKLVPIVSNVNLQFLSNFVDTNRVAFNDATGATEEVSIGAFIVSEVLFQNKDTIQYFLTFDDLVSYFYFGKGLGSMVISGSIISSCNGSWNLFNNFM